MLKRDSYILGVLLGIITPVTFYGLLYGLDLFVDNYLGRHMVRASHYLILLSITPNLFLFRYYLGKQKFTKTGLSILVLTISFVILYFLKYFENPQ